MPNNSFLLPIRGHKHGQGRWLLTVVDRFKLFARQRSVLAQPVQITEPRHLVDETSNHQASQASEEEQVGRNQKSVVPSESIEQYAPQPICNENRYNSLEPDREPRVSDLARHAWILNGRCVVRFGRHYTQSH